jgi:uridine kinase
MNHYVVGIGGRSGSGKSTLVRKLLENFGPERITLHTMDNYYLPRTEQYKDDHDYVNFDLPTSFYREDFHNDLLRLLSGREVRIKEYHFNNHVEEKVLITPTAPIILVEGLFVFHYEEINSLMNLKVLVNISLEEAYRRRLLRDQRERNYTEEEIHYRYMNHVEPSFQKFIAPYIHQMDLIVDNEDNMESNLNQLTEHLERQIESMVEISK